MIEEYPQGTKVFMLKENLNNCLLILECTLNNTYIQDDNSIHVYAYHLQRQVSCLETDIFLDKGTAESERRKRLKRRLNKQPKYQDLKDFRIVSENEIEQWKQKRKTIVDELLKEEKDFFVPDDRTYKFC